MKRKNRLVKAFLAALLTLSLILGAIPVPGMTMEVHADPVIVGSGSCGDGVTYTLTDAGVLTISGTGEITRTDWNTNIIKQVKIQQGVTGIGYMAFYWCKCLESVEIPSSVKTIGEEAFWYCENLKSIVIPEAVTSLGRYAFLHCRSLTGIKIPKNVTSIAGSAFVDCTSLTGINVDAGNTVYSSVDGALFDKNKEKLIAYPAGKCGEYVIPDSVSSIGDNAFSYCYGLTGITIPESVTNIGERAFYECLGLTNIIVPEGVTKIEKLTFGTCTKLDDLLCQQVGLDAGIR